MDKKFNQKNKNIIKFIVDEKFLIECNFIKGKYTWTSLEKKDDSIELNEPIEISRELAFEYYKSKLNEYNYKYRIRNFQDSYAEIEIKIKYNELPNSLSAEDEFFKNEELKELQIAEKTLTETQDNRMEKHIIYKIPVSKLALTENTSTTVIFKSIRKALEKIKKFF